MLVSSATWEHSFCEIFPLELKKNKSLNKGEKSQCLRFSRIHLQEEEERKKKEREKKNILSRTFELINPGVISYS